MRPLSLEEIESVRKSVLEPLRRTYLFLALIALAFFAFFLREVADGDWGALIIPAAFFGIGVIGLLLRKRQIEADLTGGLVETLEGEVQRAWRSKQEHFIRIGGKTFRVTREAFQVLSKGQTVSVDFLPRSRVAVKVEPRSSP